MIGKQFSLRPSLLSYCYNNKKALKRSNFHKIQNALVNAPNGLGSHDIKDSKTVFRKAVLYSGPKI